MSKTQEAIKDGCEDCPKIEPREGMCMWGGFVGDCPYNKSEPEPTNCEEIMNELIEKLKTNKTAFGLVALEEQECFIKVGTENCLHFDNNWRDCSSAAFSSCIAYAIKSEYQPEPEQEPTKLTEPVRTIIGTAIQFGRPTGYSPTEEDWYEIGEICRIAESQVAEIAKLKKMYRELEIKSDGMNVSLERMRQILSEAVKVLSKELEGTKR